MPIPVTSGLQLLLDASTISGSDGDLLTAWADQSGQGNDATNGSSNTYRPTYKTNIYGAHPAVRFAGSDQHMEGAFASWGTTVGLTLLVCAANIPAQNNTEIFDSIATGGTADSNLDCYTNGTAMDVYVSGASRLNAGLATINPLWGSSSVQMTTPRVVGFACDATTKRCVQNGIFWTGTHSITLPGVQTKYAVAGYLASGAYSSGFAGSFDLFHVAFYNRLLTVAEIESVTGWMLTQLGVRTASGGGIMSQRHLTGGIA